MESDGIERNKSIFLQSGKQTARKGKRKNARQPFNEWGLLRQMKIPFEPIHALQIIYSHKIDECRILPISHTMRLVSN